MSSAKMQHGHAEFETITTQQVFIQTIKILQSQQIRIVIITVTLSMIYVYPIRVASQSRVIYKTGTGKAAKQLSPLVLSLDLEKAIKRRLTPI
jgi:hypothetical protein